MLQKKLEDSIVENVLITEKASKDSSNGIYKGWVDSTHEDGNPSTLRVVMFDITNPEGVLQGEKPNVVEVGPYYYITHTKRFDIKFETDLFGEKVVTWREWKYRIFDRERTPKHLNPDDMITNVNLVFQIWRELSALQIPFKDFEGQFLDRYDDESRFGPNTDFSRMFTKRKVTEWIFGYIDEKFDVMDPNNPYFRGLIGRNITDIDDADPTRYGMFTGETLRDKANHYYMYEDKTFISGGNILGVDTMFWGEVEASQLRGSDGTRFSPFVDSSVPIFVYVSEPNRSIPLEFADETSIEGLTIYNYEIPKHVIQDQVENPRNKVYDTKYHGSFNLQKASIMPLIMTKPHFLDGAKELSDKVTGLKPDRGLHDTRIGVHDLTGLVMNATKSLQININTVGPFKVPRITPEKKWFAAMAEETHVPVAWLSELGVVEKATAKKLSRSLQLFSIVKTSLSLGITIAGVLFLAIAAGFLIAAYATKPRQAFLHAPSAYGSYSALD